MPIFQGALRLSAALGLVSLNFVAPGALAAEAVTATVTIHADQPGPQISKYIYGQFAEHLGRGIYGGIWVGEDSDIPNTRGFRNDVIEALTALRIPVIRGRTFGPQDAARPLDEAIVSRSFAERYWPGASPLGKRVRPLGGRWYTVVGEVGDVHYDRLDEPANAMVYLPIIVGQVGVEVSLPSALSLVVRTAADEGETPGQGGAGSQ